MHFDKIIERDFGVLLNEFEAGNGDLAGLAGGLAFARTHPELGDRIVDDAILGVDDNRWTKEKDANDESTERVVYSVKKIISVLMKRDSMDYEMAREYFDFNISGGYVGVHTPVFVEDEEL